jgi:hypothetical protein
LIEEINALLSVEKHITSKGNKGLKVYLKLSNGEKLHPFFMSEDEIKKMYEILMK